MIWASKKEMRQLQADVELLRAQISNLGLPYLFEMKPPPPKAGSLTVSTAGYSFIRKQVSHREMLDAILDKLQLIPSAEWPNSLVLRKFRKGRK